MALDPSIPMAFANPSMSLDPTASMMKAQSLKAAMMQGQMQQQQLQDAADFRQQYGMSPGMAQAAQKMQLGNLENVRAEKEAAKSHLEAANALNDQQDAVYQWGRKALERNPEKAPQIHAEVLRRTQENAKALFPKLDTSKSDDPASFAVPNHPTESDPSAPPMWDVEAQKGWLDSQIEKIPMTKGKLEQARIALDQRKQDFAESQQKAQSDLGKLALDMGLDTNDPRVTAKYKELHPKQSVELGLGGGGLTPEALDLMIERFRKTGDLPQVGMGKSGTQLRMQIVNGAAAKDKEQGTTTDLAGNKQAYAADKASLTKLQSNRDQLVAFENTALKNLAVFENLAKGMVDTGSPLLNMPIRKLAEQAAGSPGQAAAKAALMTVIPEFAKINSGSLTGVLSDSARHEVAAILPESATLAQIIAVGNVLKQDAHNRRTSADDMLAEIKGRGKGGNPTKSEAPVAAKVGTKKMLDSWMRDNPNKTRTEGKDLMKANGYSTEGL